MTIYDQIAAKIIKEQELLMGPVAWQQAGKVKGLLIDENKDSASIEKNNDGGVVIDTLVNRFEGLFGRAGREVCKEAVGALLADLSPKQVPSSLR